MDVLSQTNARWEKRRGSEKKCTKILSYITKQGSRDSCLPPTCFVSFGKMVLFPYVKEKLTFESKIGSSVTV